MKFLAAFGAIVFIVAGLYIFNEAKTESSSSPTCTNTTIDAYYKCQPTTPIMLRR